VPVFNYCWIDYCYCHLLKKKNKKIKDVHEKRKGKEKRRKNVAEMISSHASPTARDMMKRPVQ
jgi:hypothetical protein